MEAVPLPRKGEGEAVASAPPGCDVALRGPAAVRAGNRGGDGLYVVAVVGAGIQVDEGGEVAQVVWQRASQMLGGG